MKLINGDCLVEMGKLADEYVDAVITDPPYELGFMGKSWDSTGIAHNVEVWKQAFRVLKLGGHLLAFGGSRTYHRLACAIEDAGFEIRDQIMWIYGQGFPKSHDVSKDIDRVLGEEREKVSPRSDIQRQRRIGNVRPYMSDPEHKTVSDTPVSDTPVSDLAVKWNGWGTALKPAHEPIVLARKPLIGTVAENVMQYGTGAINIDACRVQGEPVPINKLENWSGFGQEKRPEYEATVNTSGRWPANLIHDGSEEVLENFPLSKDGIAVGGLHSKSGKGLVYASMDKKENAQDTGYGGEGRAARFFYCAKADKSERGENNVHPTVKPVALMEYLVKLVTPEGALVLDPFLGSGTTGIACKNLGRNFIGIEKEPNYFEIARKRIDPPEEDWLEF